MSGWRVKGKREDAMIMGELKKCETDSNGRFALNSACSQGVMLQDEKGCWDQKLPWVT
jgi:hypothetical protein